MCDVIIGNREEFDAVEYSTMPDNKDNEVSAKHFLNKEAQLVIVKDGEKGSIGYLKDDEPVRCSIIKVAAKKTFGSGDAYASGLLYGLFNDMSLLDAMKFGSACASITLTGMSCGEDMPTVSQTEEFMKSHQFSEVLM
jgi:5-dehydro-2-deoxygluconokinase